MCTRTAERPRVLPDLLPMCTDVAGPGANDDGSENTKANVERKQSRTVDEREVRWRIPCAGVVVVQGDKDAHARLNPSPVNAGDGTRSRRRMSRWTPTTCRRLRTTTR